MMRLGYPILATLAITGCAEKPPQPTGYPQAQYAYDATRPTSDSASGMPSTSLDELAVYSSGKGISIPQREDTAAPTWLRVRPDTLRIRFVVRAVRQTANEALSATRDASATLSQVFKQELNATTTFRGLAATELLDKERVLGIAVTADGFVELQLDKALDFWKRNELHVRTVELTKRLASNTAARDKTLAVRFQAPEAVVLNPEAFRSELIQRWVLRARTFAEAAQSEHAPLSVVDCDVPQAVEQSSVSVDEVELSLQIRCRIDAPGRPRAVPSHVDD